MTTVGIQFTSGGRTVAIHGYRVEFLQWVSSGMMDSVFNDSRNSLWQWHMSSNM